MRRWPGTILGEWGASLLRAAGVPAPVAVRVAAVLVDADMAGYPRCGIVRIATYLSAIQRGELQASAQPQVAGTQPAAVIVRGGGGFGEEALAAAVGELAVRAGRLGVAAAAVRDAYPVGRLAPFVARLARRGRLAWAWTNGDSARPRVAAVPGGGACLSGGALAGAVPRGDGRLLLLDMCLAARPASAGGPDGRRPAAAWRPRREQGSGSVRGDRAAGGRADRGGLRG